MWTNKLQLRKRLYCLKLREGDYVQDLTCILIKIFDELAVIGSPVEEEDRVVHLLASLSESYGILVTALEASSKGPMEASSKGPLKAVTKYLHEEQKQKEKDSQEISS